MAHAAKPPSQHQTHRPGGSAARSVPGGQTRSAAEVGSRWTSRIQNGHAMTRSRAPLGSASRLFLDGHDLAWYKPSLESVDPRFGNRYGRLEAPKNHRLYCGLSWCMKGGIRPEIAVGQTLGYARRVTEQGIVKRRNDEKKRAFLVSYRYCLSAWEPSRLPRKHPCSRNVWQAVSFHR